MSFCISRKRKKKERKATCFRISTVYLSAIQEDWNNIPFPLQMLLWELWTNWWLCVSPECALGRSFRVRQALRRGGGGGQRWRRVSGLSVVFSMGRCHGEPGRLLGLRAARPMSGLCKRLGPRVRWGAREWDRGAPVLVWGALVSGGGDDAAAPPAPLLPMVLCTF